MEKSGGEEKEKDEEEWEEHDVVVGLYFGVVAFRQHVT